VLPNLWPRKKNTRGGEEEEGKEGGDIEEDMADELAERANGKTQGMQEVSNDRSLEARMAAEGRKLREAETKQDREKLAKDQQTIPALRRRPGHRSMESTEDFRMPGHFE
jgi:maintenance of morphology protein 1